MIIGMTLGIMLVLVLFSLILGESLISITAEVFVDNTALVNGSITTFEVESVDVLFQIDTTNLIIAGIALLVAIGAIALITGVQVLSTGLNPQSARIIILLSGYTGIWASLSILAFNLILSIQVFGSIIYITMTISYAIGVLQKITGGE